MSKVVVLWLDGFSSRYLTPEKTPFLYRMAEQSLTARLGSLFAFAGIGFSIFAGIGINTHRVWCDWVLRENQPSRVVLRWIVRLCDLLPGDIASQYARYAAYRLLGHNPGTPNIIPVGLIDSFAPKEDKKLTDEQSVDGVVTFFDQLRAHAVPYSLSAFHESIYEGRIAKRIGRALAAGNRFVLVRMASLDRLGHKYGPESRQVTKRLGEIDRAVNELAEYVVGPSHSAQLVVFSEHGMIPVRGQVDLMAALKALPVRIGKDYFVFLNSTVACLWPKTDAARNLLLAMLGNIGHGTVIDKTQRKEFGIDQLGIEHGDILFALDEGYVFFPDFYRRRTPPMGMHGYATTEYDWPVFILHSPDGVRRNEPVREARFIDIMPTLLELLDVPVPVTCEGRSLIQAQT